MRHFWHTRPYHWLAVGLIGLTILTLAFQGGDSDVDSAHYPHPTKTPTATTTPSLTPPPPLLACQVTDIFFNEQLYPGTTITATVGVPLKVTLRVADAHNAPLIGANVDATVSQTTTVQAAAIPPLEDQSGTYDGFYLPENPGLYLFIFSVSDFTGPRFSPCSAQALVQVVPTPPPCSIALEAGPSPLKLGGTLGLTATVTNTVCANDVSVDIQVPDNSTVTVPLTGTANICSAPYIPPVTGTYTLTAKANSPGGTCRSNPPQNIIVQEQPVTSTPRIQIELPASPIELCHSAPDIAGTIVVSNVTNLTGVQVEVDYDPTFIQVIDAFGRPRPPVQVKPDPNFDPFLRNGVDTRRGQIFFSANAHIPVTSQANIFYVDWRLQGRTGTTPLTVTAVLTDATRTWQVGQVATRTVSVDPTCTQGTVNLQGRADHSGIEVFTSAGQQTQSYPSGLFAIAATESLRFTFPGYLTGRLDGPFDMVNQPGAEATQLGNITLLAGDVNGDNIINILDLATLAQHYQSTDPATDLNADGVVDILDLALIATNYQRQGP